MVACLYLMCNGMDPSSPSGCCSIFLSHVSTIKSQQDRRLLSTVTVKSLVVVAWHDSGMHHRIILVGVVFKCNFVWGLIASLHRKYSRIDSEVTRPDLHKMQLCVIFQYAALWPHGSCIATVSNLDTTIITPDVNGADFIV